MRRPRWWWVAMIVGLTFVAGLLYGVGHVFASSLVAGVVVAIAVAFVVAP